MTNVSSGRKSRKLSMSIARQGFVPQLVPRTRFKRITRVLVDADQPFAYFAGVALQAGCGGLRGGREMMRKARANIGRFMLNDSSQLNFLLCGEKRRCGSGLPRFDELRWLPCHAPGIEARALWPF